MNCEHEALAIGDINVPTQTRQERHRGVIGVDELAEYLAVPSSWVYDNHYKLGLPAIRLGRHLRFRERDVDSWLETRKRDVR